MADRPKVGVGVIVFKDGKVLLGKRKNAHGEGSWSFGGGHLEFGETWEECARREVLEETGVQVRNVRYAAVTNDIFEKEGKHYITLYMRADYESGEVCVMEPDQCECWQWFATDNLPQPLFLPIQNLLKSEFRPFH